MSMSFSVEGVTTEELLKLKEAWPTGKAERKLKMTIPVGDLSVNMVASGQSDKSDKQIIEAIIAVLSVVKDYADDKPPKSEQEFDKPLGRFIGMNARSTQSGN